MLNRGVLTAAAAGVLSLAAVAPAQAAVESNYDGVCEFNELCLYYNTGWQGSMADFQYDVPNFAGYVFKSAGNGRGLPVKNNAASACNYKSSLYAHIHYNSNYGGSQDVIAPRTCLYQLRNTYNNNASVIWLSTP